VEARREGGRVEEFGQYKAIRTVRYAPSIRRQPAVPLRGSRALGSAQALRY
jgi:hypothetical protein